MKILYLIDRGIMGGLQRHVQCLAECLKEEHSIIVCVYGEDGPIVELMRKAAIDVRVLSGKNGHDIRALPAFVSLVNSFKPDVIHAHMLQVLPWLYLALFARRIPLILSHHTSPSKPGIISRLLGWRIDYHLAVSSATLDRLRYYNPHMRGEVFYNPIRISKPFYRERIRNSGKMIVGMVARSADIKDWPSFHRVESLCASECVEFWNVGENAPCANGRERIGQMDVMLMTSFSEEMPTVILEAFAEGTAVCGFIPKGGVKEILAYSSGPLRQVFIENRDCAKLAKIVNAILNDEAFRKALIDDGWQIVHSHFDAMRLCNDQLVAVYKKLIL